MKTYLKIGIILLVFSFTKWSTARGSRFYAISPGTIGFGAISDGKKVIVSWNKANEASYDYYTIERSKDGINFVPAMVVRGAGDIGNLISYTDIDYSPFTGISFYRLKQTDHNGGNSYSETVMVNYEVTADGSIAPFTNRIPDKEELKEINNRQILVVLKDKKGEEFISRISIAGDSNRLVLKESSYPLNTGAYTIVAASYNRLCNLTLLVE